MFGNIQLFTCWTVFTLLQASVVSSMPTVTENEQLQRIQQLSGQLAESKHRETELTSSMKELREQIRELEMVSQYVYGFIS